MVFLNSPFDGKGKEEIEEEFVPLAAENSTNIDGVTISFNNFVEFIEETFL